jgi:SNF family Na+-dependent transporter
MPYPNYTRRERLKFFFEDTLPMVTPFLPSYALVLGTLLLAFYGVIPGWCRANFFFWSYQSWRSSGPRGRIINPLGPSGSDARTTVLWLSFGVFFHLYHVWLRSPFAMRLRRSGDE